MPSQRLEDLHPLIAEKAQELIESAQAEGIEILVTSTLRSFEEQAELFAIGRTKPGKKVTNAEPGKSWHNFGLAFDVVPLVNGKAIFDSLLEPHRRAGKASRIGRGGDFQSFKDRPHFEFHPNLILAQANQRRENDQNVLA